MRNLLYNRKDNFGKYYPKDSYYDKLLSSYDDLGYYKRFLNCGKKEVQISKDIKLGSEINLGDPVKSVKAHFGEPNYFYVNKNAPDNIYILLYKRKIGGLKAKLEVHFYNDQLFYFNYIFSYLNPADKALILKIIKDKYLHDYDPLGNWKAKDPNGNILFVNNDLSLNINYWTGCTYLNEAIENLINLSEKKKNPWIRREKQLYKKL